MCGGTNTTTQQVQIPPEVLARYNAVNDQAQQVAQTPFQSYSKDPADFVAQLNPTQTGGIAGTNAAAGQAQPYFDRATAGLGAAQQGFQPYADQAGQAYDQAGGYFSGAAAMAQPYIGYAQQGLGAAQQVGGQYAGLSQGALASGLAAAQPLQSSAAGNIAQGLAAAQPYNAQAQGAYYQGLGAAQPLLTAANQNIQGAQAGAQPYLAGATGLAMAGTRAVDPSALTGQSIGSYLSPYLQTVLGSTEALQNQQEQQAVSGSLGDAIKSGAFGGDRAGIAAANVAQQMQIANNATNAGILNQGYSQALQTAQQQQSLGLGAAQANRQALAGAAPEIAAIGGQGFGQGLGAAAAQAGLGGQEAGLYGGLGTQLQGLGSAIYGQSTGTGEAQAQLGNMEFQQGLQAAQQEAALGQQQFGQGLSSAQEQAALGQQTFGIGSQTGQNLQGLGASRAGLGQLTYNTGANTAQMLSGFGVGAQGAALQGAQAQLAAGQQQQQTEQAGKTALYNQFLQQQSYPFQVSQFLANIAEGTGALSGSTTTTNTPAGFFSDKRLKTDVAPIGKTFDGQTIYSYRYKDGDSRKQIGLMAQDVERKHPEAVGLAGGYKTVDYGKATEGAARRGKFAAGGLAGFDPELAQQMLANQSGYFGPFLAGSGSPYGGSARVPSANLPVHELKVADHAPQTQSLAAQAKDVADAGTSLEKGLGEAKSAFKAIRGGLGDASGASSDDPDYEGHARGGLARARFADGGQPYDETQFGPGLTIPDDRPDVQKLQQAQAIPHTESNASQFKDAAQAAAAAAKAIATIAALKRGGRVGKDDGGAVDGDAAPANLDPKKFYRDFVLPHEGGLNPRDLNGSPTNYGFNQSANPDIDVRTLTPDTAADRFASNYYAPSGAEKLDPAMAAVHADTYFMNPSRAKSFLEASGGDPDKYMDLREAWQDRVAATTPDAAKYGKAWAKRNADLRAYADNLKPPPAQAPVPTGLAAASPPPDPTAPEVATDASPVGLGVAAPPPAEAMSQPPAGHRKGLAGVLGSLTETKNLIPILDFVGGLGAAKTNNFGAALASGVMSGAQGLAQQQRLGIEQGLRGRELDIQQGQLGVSQQRANAEVLAKAMGFAADRFARLGTDRWRDNITGEILTDSQHAQRLTKLATAALPGNPSTAAVLNGGSPPTAGPTPPNPGSPITAPAPLSPPVQGKPATPAPQTSPAAPPSTPEEAIYAKADSVPQVAALRQKADSLLKEADDWTARAQDPAVLGSAVATQYLSQASNLRTLAQQQIEQWRTLREQYAQPEVATLTEAKKARFGRQNATQQQVFENGEQALQTLNQTQALVANLKDPKTGKYVINGGPAGELFARAGQIMTQFGVPPSLVTAILHTDPNDAAALEKLRTTLGTEIGRQELQGNQVRVSEWNQFLKTTPGVDLPAAASEWIIRNIIEPRASQAVNLYERVRRMDPLSDDIQGAAFDFQKSNPWWNPAAGGAQKAAADADKPPQVPKDKDGFLLPKSAEEMKALNPPDGTKFRTPDGRRLTWKSHHG